MAEPIREIPADDAFVHDLASFPDKEIPGNNAPDTKTKPIAL
jgi:hypothetical protein